VALWWVEAEANGVLPLDDRLIELFGARFKDRTVHPTNRRYTYRPPMSPLPAQAGAALGGRSFNMTASIDRDPADEGVLYASGTENSGFSFFIQDSRLVFDYNAFGAHEVVVSDREVPTGYSRVEVRVRRTGGRTGTVELFIDDVAAGSTELPLLMLVMSSVGSSVGFDNGSPVSDRYRAPFAFSGKLERVDIDADPEGHHQVPADVAVAEERAESARQ
jgi:hypothetical protein